MAARSVQDASRRPHNHLNTSKTNGFPMNLVVRQLAKTGGKSGLRGPRNVTGAARDDPRRPQDSPKTPQEATRRRHGRPKSAPKSTQRRPKTAPRHHKITPRCPNTAPRRSKTLQGHPKAAKSMILERFGKDFARILLRFSLNFHCFFSTTL